MSSVLAKFQAAYKNNPNALQGIMNNAPQTTPVQTQTAKAPVTTPTATPVQSAPTMGGMAGVTAGIKPPATPVQTPVQSPVQTAVKPPTQAPNTNYVEKGGSVLNEILYNKGIYNASNKDYIAKTVNPLYAQLDQNTATAVKGMNYDQLKNYINGLGNNASAPQPMNAPQNAATDYNSLAQAAYEREQAAMDAAAAVNSKEIGRRFDYATGVTRDNRTLRDASYYRNNAPSSWDGSGDYRTAMRERGDGIEDHYSQEGLIDAQTGAYAQANAFRDQSGNYMSTKANELQTADRNYNLQLAGLTGEINGQQTMQGKANAAQLIGQNLQNQMAQIDLSVYPQASQLKLQQLQQQVKSGAISNDTAAYQLSQLTDPNSATNQAQALELQMKQIDASSYSEANQLKLQQLRKTIAEIGKTPYQSAADQRMDQLKLEMAQIELQRMQNPTKAANAAEEYAVNYIDKMVQRDDEGVITNLPQVEATILSNPNLTEQELILLHNRYGIPIPKN